MTSFTWDVNGTAEQARIFRSKEAYEWVKANLPVHERIHKVEFSEGKAVIHRYPGREGGKPSRYEPLEPPLEVTLTALPPESLRP